MSLVFESMQVSNYFSLDHASLKFTPGIFLVEGENRDLPNFDTLKNKSVSVSNGSGKTTLFSAPYQCLFNKNSKDTKATINSVGNLYTHKPYNISMNFSKDGSDYYIENNRAHNKIFIEKDGEDITPKGVANQLVCIKNIIGFDFTTFSSLTFLNQQSLANIIDLTNKDNIVYQFFDIEKLNLLEKELKKRKKARLEDRTFLVSNLSIINKHLSLVDSFNLVDITSLKEKEATLNLTLLELKAREVSPKVKILQEKITSINEDILELNVSSGVLVGAADVLKKLQKDLASGTCPTCGQDTKVDLTKTDDELKKLRASYKLISNNILSVTATRNAHKLELTKENSDIAIQKESILVQINRVHSKLLLAEDNNLKFLATKDSLVELAGEKALLEQEAPLIDEDLRALDGLLAVLKSGAVVDVYLKKYRLLFVKNFRELKKYTSFDINIVIELNKGKMNYTFFDVGVEKSFLSLSAGERTRVSLMLLLATLKTIEQLTNITINYLVLDELLGVLDHEGLLFLERVLESMRKTKSIYIITHHNEISKDYADGIIKVVRENNLTTIED